MAEGLYATFDRAATQANNNWYRRFVLPYSSAYVKARTKFMATIDDQKKADEARRQRILSVAMFAFSLCGGSILTHVFGSACAKTIAGQVAVDVIADREMHRAWKVANFIHDNKTAQFAVGKVWDTAADLLPDLKAKLAETPSNFKSLADFSQEPQVLQNHLDKWVRDAYAGLLAAEDEISKTISDEKKKTELVKELIASPFVRTVPASDLPEDKTSEDIELCLYMNAIRGLDYLADVTIEERNRGWTKRETRRGSIEVSPSDKNYPQYKRSNGFGDYQTVKFDRFGGVLRDRVDELHKKMYKSKFFLHDETISQSTLLRAEQKLEQMAHVNLDVIRRSLATPAPPTGLPPPSKDMKMHGSFPVPIR